MSLSCCEEKGQNKLHGETVQYLILKRTHKFRLKLPKMVEVAVSINEKNGNTLCQDAIQKEMENVKVTFQTLVSQ